MAPAFAQFEQAHRGKIDIISVDVSDEAAAQRYREYKASAYIPETVIVHNGKAVARETGALSLEQLEALLAKAGP